ncbi:hypothetical protein [Cytobacillus purgationiresistens]|uniref:Uncharacterized protein n=1 Tax=Cytobacillus purgationiresistens TaxID=863449 RepID=A0ABU0AJA2_9BACI|nr:hypothetical protein [Cytobacillus purgationiresistens]MDQ0271343.1 hypothetical protein [Cytobacillus purgationiresistens]
MKTIKIELEYQCYPMWIYNEKGELIDNSIANELANETLIVKALDEIQEAYDNLFEDNEVNFEYKGFAQEQEREQFLLLVSETVDSIKSKLSNVYRVENKVNL